MRSQSNYKTAGRHSLILVALAATSCVTHVEDYHPSISVTGFGRVVAVENIAANTGESAADRYAMGFALGGVPGALIVGNAEKDIGKATLFNYTLRLSDGSNLQVHSFSAVAIDDCVKIIRVSSRAEMVLERLDDRKLCQAAPTS